MYKNYEEKGEYICLIQIKENSYIVTLIKDSLMILSY